ncbi:MAG TPA: GNAT family N-acetyltransferase [Steroidobacteraceae bacterium]|nr:GNAT family N-acetyltransferase [Steroidobacteraceae bacterium]
MVRRLRQADIPAVIEIFRASVRITARRDYTHEQVMAWAPDHIDPAAWAKRYDTRQGWVAEAAGSQLAGFIELEGASHLDMLYVHPAQQRRGVASALLQQLESAARELGAQRLHTEASLTARSFFERRGFLLLAEQTVALRGQSFVNFRMAKSLVGQA